MLDAYRYTFAELSESEKRVWLPEGLLLDTAQEWKVVLIQITLN